MSRFLNIKAGKGEGIGLGDVDQTFLQSATSTAKEVFLGDTGFGQDILATEVVKEYAKAIKDSTGEDIFKFRTDRDHIVNSMRGMGSFDTVQGVKRFEQELKALHEKDPTKFRLKSLDELKQEYLAKKDKTFAGEQPDNKNIAGSLVGGALGFIADPINMLVTGVPIGQMGLAARSLFSALGEVVVQSSIDSSISQKAMNIAGAGVAPGLFKGLAVGGRITAKAAGKAVRKGITQISQKSGTLNRNFTKNIDKAADSVEHVGLKENLKVRNSELKMFKGSKKEAMLSHEKAKVAFEEYKPVGNATRVKKPSKAKFVKQKDGKFIPAREDALRKRIASGKVSGEALDEARLGIERPVVTGFDAEIHTTTGKYSTVFDEKSGKAMVFTSSTDAERGLKDLGRKGVDIEEMQVAATPRGEFAIVKSSDASIVPRTKDFNTAKEAEASIPAVAKKVGLEPEDLKALKVEKDGKSVYKLATHASERDVLSAEKGILNNFDEGGAKLETGLSDGAEDVLPAAKKFKEKADIAKTVSPEELNKSYERQLDQIMKDDTIKYEVPGYGDKKKFNKFIEDSKKAIDEFNECIG